MKTAEEIMDDVDKTYQGFIDMFIDYVIRVLSEIMGMARNRFYDVLVYFGYSVALIRQFGDNGVVNIQPYIIDDADKGKRYRIDQTKNEDGSLTLTLVEITKEEKENEDGSDNESNAQLPDEQDEA